jgi:2-polyprenyl-6-methoxyphenol hydroxylase-like FAD-dependent oxidoreductase
LLGLLGGTPPFDDAEFAAYGPGSPGSPLRSLRHASSRTDALTAESLISAIWFMMQIAMVARNERQLRVLISGAGIAGPTLAYWLARHGIAPTLVENAPALRTGGYVIDFWGAGFEVASRMGLLPDLVRTGYAVREVRVVDRDGRRAAGFPGAAFARAVGGRFTSLPRGDLAAAIYGALGDTTETIFGDAIARIDQAPDEVHVTFERHGSRTFDLVVGADGLHSRVRELAFGPETQFERYLGIKVAAFEAEAYRPRDELVYMMYTQVGQEVSRFSMRNDRTMFLFTFADPDPRVPSDLAGQKALLHERFGNSGWECPQILDALDATRDLYFDRVSQIEMNESWSNNRVTLVGDAAFCVSLLGGQGSALAMAAAYILAGELHRTGGRHEEALVRYQQLFGPFVSKKQRAARRFAGAFAPKSRTSLFVRNRLFGLFSIGWIADLIAGREFTDRIALPDY